MTSQRKKTAPPTPRRPRSSSSSRKGLIATEKTKKQSAKKRTALDNRFHRTSVAELRAGHPRRPHRGAMAAATDEASEGARCGQRAAMQLTLRGPRNGPRVSSSAKLGRRVLLGAFSSHFAVILDVLRQCGTKDIG